MTNPAKLSIRARRGLVARGAVAGVIAGAAGPGHHFPGGHEHTAGRGLQQVPASVIQRGNNGQDAVTGANAVPIGLPGSRGPDVVEFVQRMLADGPVSVARVEAKARDAGLLGPSQQITGAKLFRQASRTSGGTDASVLNCALV
jgi:hypothetical protein